MNKTLVGAICALIAVVGVSEAYKMGYNKGVDDCKRMVKLAAEVAESVKKKES